MTAPGYNLLTHLEADDDLLLPCVLTIDRRQAAVIDELCRLGIGAARNLKLKATRDTTVTFVFNELELSTYVSDEDKQQIDLDFSKLDPSKPFHLQPPFIAKPGDECSDNMPLRLNVITHVGFHDHYSLFGLTRDEDALLAVRAKQFKFIGSVHGGMGLRANR